MEWLSSVKELFTFARGRDQRIDKLFESLRSMTEASPFWGDQHQALADQMVKEVQAARVERRIGLGVLVLAVAFLALISLLDRDQTSQVVDPGGGDPIIVPRNMTVDELYRKLDLDSTSQLSMEWRHDDGAEQWLVRDRRIPSRVLGSVQWTRQRGDIDRVDIETPLGEPLRFDEGLRLLAKVRDYQGSLGDTLHWEVMLAEINSENDTLWTLDPILVKRTASGVPQQMEFINHPRWSSPYVIHIGVGRGGSSKGPGGDLDRVWAVQATARRIGP